MNHFNHLSNALPDLRKRDWGDIRRFVCKFSFLPESLSQALYQMDKLFNPIQIYLTCCLLYLHLQKVLWFQISQSTNDYWLIYSSFKEKKREKCVRKQQRNHRETRRNVCSFAFPEAVIWILPFMSVCFKRCWIVYLSQKCTPTRLFVAKTHAELSTCRLNTSRFIWFCFNFWHTIDLIPNIFGVRFCPHNTQHLNCWR